MSAPPILHNEHPAAHWQRGRVLLVIAVLAVAAGAGWYWWQRPAVVEPPVVVVSASEPEVADAVNTARDAVRQSPRSGAAWGELGLVLSANTFNPQALVCFAQAERLSPEEFRWPYFQGLLLAPEHPDAAILKLERAVQLGGGGVEAPRLRLAETLLSQARYGEAEEQFNKVLSAEPDNARALLGMGRIAYERGDAPGSLPRLRLAASSPFTQKAARTLLVKIYKELKDEKAVADEERAVAALPEDPPWPDPFLEEGSRRRVGVIADTERILRLLAQNHVQEALPALHRLVTDNPNSGQAWMMLGQALLKQGDSTRARPALVKAVELEPNLVNGHFFLGAALFAQNDFQAASASFRRATELKPDYELAHYNLGHCLKRLGDRPGAIAAIGAAVRCKPNLAEAHLELGEMLALDGKKDAALVHLRHAVQLNHPKAKKALDELLASPPAPAKR